MTENSAVGVYTGAVNVSAKSAYSHSFGCIPDKTRYVDGWQGYDMRAQIKSAFDIGFKALTSASGGAGTAGNAMVPVYLDPRIVDTTRKFTPLVELIPRVTNQGLTADYNKITAKGGGFTAAEDSAMAERNDTYERASTAIKSSKQDGFIFVNISLIPLLSS